MARHVIKRSLNPRSPLNGILRRGRNVCQALHGGGRAGGGQSGGGGGGGGGGRGGAAAGGGAGAGRRGGSSTGGGGGKLGGSGSGSAAFNGFEGFEIDRAAVKEAGRVAAQLLAAVGRLARADTRGDTRGDNGGESSGDSSGWCAPGVGGGDPTGPVFEFLLGEGAGESGVLLAMAYPDRVAVRRSKVGRCRLPLSNPR